MKLVREYNIAYYETSAKTNINILEPIEHACHLHLRQLLNDHKKKKSNKKTICAIQ